MLDGFARSITYLRISITDRCNYRCRYCMPDGGIEKCAHEDICSLEGLRDMAAAAVRCGVKKIRVTGGEPLVRRGAVDFCRMLSEIPGVEELCVTTNGSLLKEFARPLRDAGVTHLNISLDTLNEERFRAITRLGTLQDTLDGIEAAERAATAKKQPQFAPSQRILRTASAARELDIRGMETLEAESVLDNYIDAAVMAHLETVTIIHGKGTGALRKAVHASLRRNKAVKSFRLGNYGEGESGVTVVELK